MGVSSLSGADGEQLLSEGPDDVYSKAPVFREKSESGTLLMCDAIPSSLQTGQIIVKDRRLASAANLCKKKPNILLAVVSIM